MKIFADNALSTGARLLYLAMWYDADPNHQDIARSNLLTSKSHMRERLGGKSLNTLNRWVRELRDQGWLSSVDETAVQAWDLHKHATGRDPAPTRVKALPKKRGSRKAREAVRQQLAPHQSGASA